MEKNDEGRSWVRWDEVEGEQRHFAVTTLDNKTFKIYVDGVQKYELNDSIEAVNEILFKLGSKIIITKYKKFEDFDNYLNKDDIKEDKVEKIIVRNWDDIKDHYYFGLIDDRILKFNNVKVLDVHNLKEAVKVLNALGGNFEYFEVQVIDTFEKFKKFLLKNRLDYKPINTNLILSTYDRSKFYSLEKAEKTFNVDLKILK